MEQAFSKLAPALTTRISCRSQTVVGLNCHAKAPFDSPFCYLVEDQPRVYASGSGASCSWLTSDLSSGPRALRMADEISLKYGLVELMLLPLQRGKRLLQPADRWKHQTRL
jgi:hypothetical protein